jgi:hypothetical protein
MGAQVKRDASQASTRLTKRNLPPSHGHLLSTFNKQTDVIAERAPDVAQPSIEAVQQELDINAVPMSSSPRSSPHSSPLSSAVDVEDPGELDAPASSPELVLQSTEVALRPEPGTEDEPMSTEDESSDSDALPPNKETNYMTLQQKLAEDKNGSRKSGLSRTRSDSYEDMLFSSSYRSSQSKRARPNVYKTNAKSYFNPPSFPKSTSEKPSPRAKPKAKKEEVQKKTKVEEPKELEGSFIVPKDMEDLEYKFKPQMKNGDSSSFGTFSSKENDTLQYYSDADSPLSSAPSSMFKEMEEKLEQPSPPSKALCPMCKTEVDPEILALFQSQPKQRIREQQQFCQSHQLRTAAQQWEKHGYPVIVWDEFESRIQGLFPDLEKLLVPDASSYYRNILDDVLKAGKASNLRLTLDGKGLEVITCGYYGAKGASKMYVSWICPGGMDCTDWFLGCMLLLNVSLYGCVVWLLPILLFRTLAWRATRSVFLCLS